MFFYVLFISRYMILHFSIWCPTTSRTFISKSIKIKFSFPFSGMKIYTLPFKLPEIGSVLGGLLELRGSHISLACFHGINFKSKSWALFSLKDPSISFVSDAQEILEEANDLNKKIRNTTVIQTLSFSLGQSDQVCRLWNM